MAKSFLESKQWKNLIAKLYGIGAALVIIGALFKLQHWQGAGWMLSIGMLTEFVIFLFSAFDPPAKDYHWEKVHPELLGDGEAVPAGMPPAARVMHGGAQVPSFNGLDVDPAVAEEIKRNLDKFNDTVKSLNSLSAIAETSNTFIGGVQQAAGSVDNLNKSINMLGEAYKQSTQALQAGGKQTGENMDLLNKHIGAVNASYELYIQTHKQYVATGEQYLNAMKQSAETSRQFSEQMNKLNNKIGELDTIYGSMISTVNTALKR